MLCPHRGNAGVHIHIYTCPPSGVSLFPSAPLGRDLWGRLSGNLNPRGKPLLFPYKTLNFLQTVVDPGCALCSACLPSSAFVLWGGGCSRKRVAFPPVRSSPGVWFQPEHSHHHLLPSLGAPWGTPRPHPHLRWISSPGAGRKSG